MPPSRCVVQDCDRVADKQLGISVHTSPGTGTERAMWKRFVSQHRKHFKPNGTFGICSLQFTDDCFTRSVQIKGTERRLKPGSVPSIWKKGSVFLSERTRHRLLNEIMREQSQDANIGPEAVVLEENQVIQVNDELQGDLGLQAVGCVQTTEADEAWAEVTQVTDEGVQDEELMLVADDGAQAEVIQRTDEVQADGVLLAQVADEEVQDKEVILVADDGLITPCESCRAMKAELTQLKAKVTQFKNKLSSNQEQWVQTFKGIQEQNRLFMVNTAVQTEPVVETEDTSPTKSMDQPTEQDEDFDEDATDVNSTT
ncbi:uncharacterized protein LOC111345958 isoform X1 [Stylophora pistillata]|uniref:THAP domain-containing protein 2 n=1 Tax=Stylophora pistillata TaxID=50429 RepID=A0A2B4RB42_STYPI|nr:uncharacterized protein LOC111345958 isoform X1 [Stylophora pistillata]PFX13505.1 THAP domain-containing protein 2 [Stylophora pistillata]